MKFILGWSLFKEQFADNLELDGVVLQAIILWAKLQIQILAHGYAKETAISQRISSP